MRPRDFRGRPSWCLRVFGIGLVLAFSAAAVLAQAPEKKGTASASMPPWQRVLQGEDAQRVEALEKTIGDLETKGQYAGAVGPAREALAIRHRVQGEDHWQTVTARFAEQKDVRMAGRPREARTELAATLGQYEAAQKLFQGGRYAEAERLLRTIVEVCRRTLGADHPDTATCYESLAACLHGQGRYAETEPLYQQARAIHLHTVGQDHPGTASCYNGRATSLDLQGMHRDGFGFEECHVSRRVPTSACGPLRGSWASSIRRSRIRASEQCFRTRRTNPLP